MHNKTSQSQPFKPPSTWSPESTFNLKLEDYLEATKFELAHIRLKQQTNNMTKKHRSALLQLKKKEKIVIKPYDKGRGICIMNTLDYLAVGFRHLSSQHYKQLEQDTTQDTSQLVHNALTKMANQNIINSKTYEYLDPLKQKVVCPTMYFLPKIHKTPPAREHFIGRPITCITDILRKLAETSFPQDVQYCQEIFGPRTP